MISVINDWERDLSGRTWCNTVGHNNQVPRSHAFRWSVCLVTTAGHCTSHNGTVVFVWLLISIFDDIMTATSCSKVHRDPKCDSWEPVFRVLAPILCLQVSLVSQGGTVSAFELVSALCGFAAVMSELHCVSSIKHGQGVSATRKWFRTGGAEPCLGEA